MSNSLNEKTGNLASTVWQNANIATAKSALGTVAGTAGAVASGVGSTIYKQAGTTGAVVGFIGSSIYKQAARMMDRNQKLKETFACYYVEDIHHDYVGTIHFTKNGFFFSSEASLPQHIKNTERDLPLLPPGVKSWKEYHETRGLVSDRKIALEWGHIKKIDTGGDTQNPFERRIVIHTNNGHFYMFMGFLNHTKHFVSEFQHIMYCNT